MLPNEAFAEVIKTYKIKQHELVKKSGLDKGVVSRFINGESDIKARNLQKLVLALPPKAKAYYYTLYFFEDDIKMSAAAEKPNRYKV